MTGDEFYSGGFFPSSIPVKTSKNLKPRNPLKGEYFTRAINIFNVVIYIAILSTLTLQKVGLTKTYVEYGILMTTIFIIILGVSLWNISGTFKRVDNIKKDDSYRRYQRYLQIWNTFMNTEENDLGILDIQEKAYLKEILRFSDTKAFNKKAYLKYQLQGE